VTAIVAPRLHAGQNAPRGRQGDFLDAEVRARVMAAAGATRAGVVRRPPRPPLRRAALTRGGCE